MVPSPEKDSRFEAGSSMEGWRLFRSPIPFLSLLNLFRAARPNFELAIFDPISVSFRSTFRLKSTDLSSSYFILGSISLTAWLSIALVYSTRSSQFLGGFGSGYWPLFPSNFARCCLLNHLRTPCLYLTGTSSSAISYSFKISKRRRLPPT